MDTDLYLKIINSVFTFGVLVLSCVGAYLAYLTYKRENPYDLKVSMFIVSQNQKPDSPQLIIPTIDDGVILVSITNAGNKDVFPPLFFYTGNDKNSFPIIMPIPNKPPVIFKSGGQRTISVKLNKRIVETIQSAKKVGIKDVLGHNFYISKKDLKRLKKVINEIKM